MSDFSITVKSSEVKEVQRVLNNISGIESEVAKQIQGVAIRGHRKAVKETPKRTGTGRRSWRIIKQGRTSRNIKSTYIPIVVLENGRRAVIIRPKRGKYLMFAVSDKALTFTKAQVKQSSKRAYWKALKEAKKAGAENPHQVATARTGVAIAKKVKQKARIGTKFIEIKIIPSIEKDFFSTVNSIIDGAIK